jgi:hypothetical protein
VHTSLQNIHTKGYFISYFIFYFILFYFITKYYTPQMLTCVNPKVMIKVDDSTNKVTCVAIALKWLLAMISDHGSTPPPDYQIRQEIRSLDIGFTNSRKQFFNKYANGDKINRGPDGVEVQSKNCVFVKHSAFGSASWDIFSTGIVLN